MKKRLINFAADYPGIARIESKPHVTVALFLEYRLVIMHVARRFVYSIQQRYALANLISDE
jgi:hypothetical protein